MINDIKSNPTKYDFGINDEIKNYVFGNIPTDLTKLEQSIYIYSKLCKILDYNFEYYIDNNDQRFIVEENISKVDLSNNNVVCYTFTQDY